MNNCDRGGIPDFVKVLDFGLAKPTDVESHLTMGNVISGTPSYISPETVSQSDSLDGRSDLYSLACVGYFMLAGRHLFSKPKTMETLMAHTNETPPTGAEMGVEIPDDLEAVLRKCLAKNPADRYQTAEDLRAALKSCRDYRTWTEESARAWWGTHTMDIMATQKLVSPGSGEQIFTVKIDTTSEEIINPS